MQTKKVLTIRIGNAIGGAEIFNQRMLKEFSQNPHINVTLFTNVQGLSSIQNVKTYRIKPPINEIGTKKDVITALIRRKKYLEYYRTQISKHEKNGKLDIVILNSITEKIFLTKKLQKEGKKVIWIEHGPFFKFQNASFLKTAYKRESKFASKIIAVSKDTKSNLILNGIDQKKVVVGHCGIDTKFWTRSTSERERQRKKLHIKKFQTCLIFVGSLNKSKGIDKFVNTATELLKHNNNFYFIVLGQGVEQKKVEKFKSKFPNQVYFKGWTDNVKDFLQASDILLFPTEHLEGRSLVILEAMAMNNIIVSHNIGGIPELASKKTGLIYKHFDVNEVVHFFLSLDRRTMNAMKANSRREVEKFSSKLLLKRLFNTIVGT